MAAVNRGTEQMAAGPAVAISPAIAVCHPADRGAVARSEAYLLRVIFQ
jgi:hypothetical protein